jgi:hypothetical protein
MMSALVPPVRTQRKLARQVALTPRQNNRKWMQKCKSR